MPGPDASGGVLLVDKPVGPTSHDVVARARRALGTRRVGHAGTLDPFASGLLLLCVGAATRLVEYATALEKRYVAELELGVATDTDDVTGEPVARSDAWQSVTRAALAAALDAQQGALLQTPPQYSAKKVGGERSHRVARRGGALELAPVPVTVHAIALLDYAPPAARFEVLCSSGTYMRAIARDVGATLGCGAHLTALRRTAIGPFRVEEALALEALQPGLGADALRPPIAAVAHLPPCEVDEAGARRLALGQALPLPHGLDDGPVAVLHGNRLVAIAEARAGGLRPRKVLAHD
jgi:tRNA pseudouridine55 synthase